MRLGSSRLPRICQHENESFLFYLKSSKKACKTSINQFQGFVVHPGVNMDMPKSLHCGCNMSYPAFVIAESNCRLAEKC